MKKGMQGWKTWTGVVGLVFTKLATLYFDVDMAAAESTATTLVQAIQAVMAGLAAVGVAHKVEKIAPPEMMPLELSSGEMGITLDGRKISVKAGHTQNHG